MVVGQAVAIFFIFNYIPTAMFFTQRQWFLYKRFKIRNSMTQNERKQRVTEFERAQFWFAFLLWITVAFNLFYSVLYGFYLYYALLVDPCKHDLRQCPKLAWIALSILILQIMVYLNYIICCVLLFISMKRIHTTIKKNYIHWNTDCC